MIIFNNYTYQTYNDNPDSDWTGTAKYVVADGSDLANKIINDCPYGFVPVEDTDGNLIDVTPNDEPLETAKARKREEITNACNDTIIAGIEYNNEHYSLTENDQINLASLYNMSLQTPAPSLLYHADGELCRSFTADEIQAIMATATQHKTYQTTYCNHMFAWIDRLTSSDDVNAITYGDTLPDDLLSHLREVLGIEQDS